MTYKVKVAWSGDASDRYWPISGERKGTETPKFGLLHAGAGHPLHNLLLLFLASWDKPSRYEDIRKRDENNELQLLLLLLLL